MGSVTVELRLEVLDARGVNRAAHVQSLPRARAQQPVEPQGGLGAEARPTIVSHCDSRREGSVQVLGCGEGGSAAGWRKGVGRWEKSTEGGRVYPEAAASYPETGVRTALQRPPCVAARLAACHFASWLT